MKIVGIETGSAPKPKRLPRNPENGFFKGDFEANGKRYFIANPENGFPLSRDTIFGKFMAMYWYGGTFNTPVQRRTRMAEVINGLISQKTQITDLVLANQEELKAVQELSEAKFDFSLYLCTTFIFEESETLADNWEQSKAESKISDWSEYAREDFFELAALFIIAYNNTSARLLEAVAKTLDAAMTPKKSVSATNTTRNETE